MAGKGTGSLLCPWCCVASLPVFLSLLGCCLPGPCPMLILGTDQLFLKHRTVCLQIFKPCIECFNQYLQSVSALPSLPIFFLWENRKVTVWCSKKIIIDPYSFFSSCPSSRRLSGLTSRKCSGLGEKWVWLWIPAMLFAAVERWILCLNCWPFINTE